MVRFLLEPYTASVVAQDKLASRCPLHPAERTARSQHLFAPPLLSLTLFIPLRPIPLFLSPRETILQLLLMLSVFD